jgi:cytochrome c oxidase cbb3-type subunit III
VKTPRHPSAWAPLALALAACSSSNGAPAAPSGKDDYARNCALCHGVDGEGYAADDAPALANPEFLAIASDAYLTDAIKRGRPGTTMSSWSTTYRGPFDDARVASLVAFLRGWQTSPTLDVGAAPVAGNVAAGASAYAEQCASCHGATGNEGRYIHLANPVLLADATDGFLRTAIARGRPPTRMPSFEATLPPSTVNDLVALLRSWQTPVPPGDVPVPGTAGAVVLNPNGPDPGFALGQQYTPADQIKAALDANAALTILDARLPSDYALSHVAGALNVPFYEADAYRSALPTGTWIVCYCGCPHAESGALADDLLQHGFTKVTILDEGFFVWKGRGYPVRSGADP